MTTIPEGVLASILDRLDRLEQTRQGTEEALSPSYLTIDPVTGLVPVIIDSAGNSVFVQLAGPARQQRMGNPARIYRHGGYFAPVGYAVMPFDTVVSDPDGAFQGGAGGGGDGSYQAPYAGMYLAMGCCQIWLQNNPQDLVWLIGLNGTEFARGTGITIRGGVNGDRYSGTAVAIVPCSVGDKIQLLTYNSGGNQCAVDQDLNYFHVQQIA